LSDNVHISISSKYAVSQVVGFIKGKNAISINKVFGRGDIMC